MPRYDYTCPHCGETEVHFVSYEKRNETQPCSNEHCSGMAQYQFPVGAMEGLQIQEAAYFEPLGVDISGKRELRQVLKAMNLQEAGDRAGS